MSCTLILNNELHTHIEFQVDSNHAINLANYAEFLAHACSEIERAEEFYVRGLRVNPSDHVLMRKFGVYLRDLKKTEAHANEVPATACLPLATACY